MGRGLNHHSPPSSAEVKHTRNYSSFSMHLVGMIFN
jgi:hypothetical protein